MHTDYAIKTIDLVKRYPSSTGGTSGRGGGGGPGGGRSLDSFSGIINILRGRKRSYIEALRGINLQINKGEVFGLLGPNGAGKTTLIKILCTLVIHDEGDVFVNGYDIRKNPADVVRNLQAVLPESRGFNWRLTGRQNLAFYSLLYGINEKEAKERIDYLLELTGLRDRADDSYQRYSTGMQRRLLLCRALLRNTPILLFDEPTSGLDPTAAADFRSLVRNKLAREEGTTIMMSTHNLYEAQEICDRIAILERGRIIACDTPKNLQNSFNEQKTLEITFSESIITVEQEKSISTLLMQIHGVRSVASNINRDRSSGALSISMDKEIDVTNIIEGILKSNFKITSINTSDPSLEDVFVAITRGYKEQQKKVKTDDTNAA